MHGARHDIPDGLLAIERVAEARLGLLRLLGVLATLLPQRLYRVPGVDQELVGLLDGAAVLSHCPWGALALGEHAVSFLQQHSHCDLRDRAF